jgi:hypothetical protein
LPFKKFSARAFSLKARYKTFGNSGHSSLDKNRISSPYIMDILKSIGGNLKGLEPRKNQEKLRFINIKRRKFAKQKNYLEREKGFEPSTLTLARLCSTPELLPLKEWYFQQQFNRLR